MRNILNELQLLPSAKRRMFLTFHKILRIVVSNLVPTFLNISFVLFSQTEDIGPTCTQV